MKIRRPWWLGASGLVTALAAVLLAVPAMAATSAQEGGSEPDTYTAMHEACGAGDVQGMTEGMDDLTDEDWQAMGEHMGDGHHGAMGSGTMGGGGMMGGWPGQGMMSW